MTAQELGQRDKGGLASTLLADAAQLLSKAGLEDAAREARYLFGLATGEGGQALARQAGAVDALEAQRFSELVARRAQHEPFAYLAGRKEFWSLEFEVSPAVLIPRPDTETLVELALSHFAGRDTPQRILDLGTGSGCLLLALLSEWPHAQGTGVDVSAEALGVARANASRLGLAGRARFHEGDWCRGLEGPFDLAVSNPPYVTQAEWDRMALESRGFEPALALLGGDGGLDCYRRIAAQAGQVLVPNGLLVVESGAGQARSIIEIFSAQNWEPKASRRDLAGHERALAFRVPATPV